MEYQTVVEGVGSAVEIAGVVVIVVGGLIASVLFVLRSWGADGRMAAYRQYRRGLGRSILLGLEFLVAGDIISTVAIEPTFHSLGILAGLVAIRTALSFSLEVELTGAWPWQRREEEQRSSA